VGAEHRLDEPLERRSLSGVERSEDVFNGVGPSGERRSGDVPPSTRQRDEHRSTIGSWPPLDETVTDEPVDQPDATRWRQSHRSTQLIDRSSVRRGEQDRQRRWPGVRVARRLLRRLTHGVSDGQREGTNDIVQPVHGHASRLTRFAGW
jgi:hypothetical protein